MQNGSLKSLLAEFKETLPVTIHDQTIVFVSCSLFPVVQFALLPRVILIFEPLSEILFVWKAIHQ